MSTVKPQHLLIFSGNVVLSFRRSERPESTTEWPSSGDPTSWSAKTMFSASKPIVAVWVLFSLTFRRFAQGFWRWECVTQPVHVGSYLFWQVSLEWQKNLLNNFVEFDWKHHLSCHPIHSTTCSWAATSQLRTTVLRSKLVIVVDRMLGDSVDTLVSSVLVCIRIFLVNSLFSHLYMHTPEAGVLQLAETIGNLPRGLVWAVRQDPGEVLLSSLLWQSH